MDGAESAEYTVGHGLREGAVLSPVLYAVFIDDIARRLEASCSGVSVGGEAGEAVRCLLYADDICITADSQEDLQRALNVCQSFANESSFEYSMEKSQVVIFGGDYSFNAPAFTLMGQTMESVDRYKYLGLWFHESLGRPNGPRAPSRPPKSVASEYLQQRFIDEPGPGENTPVEERCIVGLWFNPNAGREGSWVAETRRLDEDVDAETVEYYAGPRTSMKRMMERYCFLHKDYEPPTFRALDPWELQIEHICRSISVRTGLLRRLGCHPHGLACSTARLAACTLTDAVSIINSEVWSSSCPESQYHDIAVALNIIYRRLLGVEAKTASVAVWHELGVASVATRINAAALKFHNNILSYGAKAKDKLLVSLSR